MKENSFKKNDEITLSIEDISDDGSGIGKSDGFIFFVKNTLPGDRIKAGVTKVMKNFGYARVIELFQPSPGRCSARCSVSDKCGGCTLQNYDYKKQLEYKYGKVKNNLIRIGEVPAEEVERVLNPIIGMDDPYRYRNKAQYPVRCDRNGKIKAGFFAGHTHSVIESEDCVIEPEINSAILRAVTDWMEKNHISAYDDETGKGLIRHILIRHGFTSKECQVNLIINGNKIPDEKGLIFKLKELLGDDLKSVTLCPNKRKDNVILGDSYKNIYGEGYITDTLMGIKFRISPLSFYQVNPIQTERLYGLAREYAGLTGSEEVLDLYCGIGTISLMLAGSAGHVTGIEIIDRAISDARENARINNIENADFITGAAEDVIQGMVDQTNYSDMGVFGDDAVLHKESEPDGRNNDSILSKAVINGRYRCPDVVVVDPPRKGCARSCIDAILTLAPSRVVYVSCDPATLARDIKLFREGGYELKSATPVDMFPHSAHVETVCLMSRTEGK